MQEAQPRDAVDAVYEVRPRKDQRGVDLIADALPFGRLWYGHPNAVSNAIDYAKFYSRSHGTVIRVYDEAGLVGRPLDCSLDDADVLEPEPS